MCSVKVKPATFKTVFATRSHLGHREVTKRAESLIRVHTDVYSVAQGEAVGFSIRLRFPHNITMSVPLL